MNQKNLIVILFVIILVLTGIVGYFVINKSAIQQNQNKDVFQNNQNQQSQTIKNTASQTDNLTKLEEFGIELEFSDGYDIAKSEGKTIILFGPLGGDLGPVPTDRKSHIYDLLSVEKRTPNEIVAQVNKDGGELITVKPEIKTINNLTVVKWAEGGFCENRMIEVVGPKNNYRFSSLGCHQEQKFDFDYFEKTIKTIKFL